jgi:hypothetical protein
MINAQEARKTAESNKAHVDEVAQILNHFEQLIRRASNQGKFEIDKQTFAADRFSQLVIDEVIKQLKDRGFKVTLGKNNALNQIIFTVTW